MVSIAAVSRPSDLTTKDWTAPSVFSFVALSIRVARQARDEGSEGQIESQSEIVKRLVTH